MSPAGGHLGFSIGPKSNNTWLAVCNSILHVVSEKKIIKTIGQTEDFMAPGSHVGLPIIAKVTPLGQTMQTNIPATFGPICFSGSLEEDCNVYERTTDDERRTQSDGNSSHDPSGQVS